MSFVQSIIKNPTRSLKNVPKGSSTVMTAGYVLAWSSGLAILGTNSTVVADVIGVCNQSITAGEALTQVPVIEVFQNDVWLVDSTNNSNEAHNGQKMILGANGGIVNNTGTTSATGIVQQVGTFGTASDKKILVRFLNTA
jgi:hypothetical protein